MAVPDVVVRECRRDELPAVLALWGLARSPHARTPDTADAVARLLDDAPGSLLVAERAGRIVGALIAAWDGWRGNMYRLAVHPDHRRAGIARRLVEAGERQLRARGANRVTALVPHDDAVARAAWTAAGYTSDPVIGRFVRNL
jgi:ribosomal protein S18 acetylase RimI-like enzyme